MPSAIRLYALQQGRRVRPVGETVPSMSWRSVGVGLPIAIALWALIFWLVLA